MIFCGGETRFDPASKLLQLGEKVFPIFWNAQFEMSLFYQGKKRKKQEALFPWLQIFQILFPVMFIF
jgi:hypothetical protein